MLSLQEEFEDTKEVIRMCKLALKIGFFVYGECLCTENATLLARKRPLAAGPNEQRFGSGCLMSITLFDTSDCA